MIAIMSDMLSGLFHDGRDTSLGRGETLFRAGDRVRFMYMIEAGRIELLRHSKEGNPMVLHRAGKGQVPAEASGYSTTYHCDGLAAEATVLRSLPVAVFRERVDRTPALAGAWAASLAHSLQGARLNAEIRTLRTVAERVDAWLGEGSALPPKGEWQNLAYRLGVTREALYRELARRREKS